MTHIFNSFVLFSQISEELKQKIKIFNVFDDKEGYNVLFVTNDDTVYGFGSNDTGCCGLGHNKRVDSPLIIPELCHKNIKQFFSGYNCVLALNCDNQLYGWGCNDTGQLATGIVNRPNEYLKPVNIKSPENQNIIEISCGTSHSLVLTSNGSVFGWGWNKFGQIGCGKQTSDAISTPIQLKSLIDLKIKSIYCFYCRSYVLTNDGLVYSWGSNDFYELGHELDRSESIFEPKLIDISNVISICPSIVNTYFLTNEGLIYFCGKFKDENKSELFQKSPKLLETKTEIKIKSLHSIPYYQKMNAIPSAVTQEYVYSIKWNQFSKTEFKTIFDFYSKVFEMTLNTIELNENKSIIVSQNRNEESNNHFNDHIFNSFVLFSQISEELKQKIKIFNVFDDDKGYNVLFVTNDDTVYGFGSNQWGVCGLGHNERVDSPLIIPELCHKNIKQFFNGYSFVLALNCDNQLYGWGRNDWGQLAIGRVNKWYENLKPIIIESLNNEDIVDISCGSAHSLVLTSNGSVFGWGANNWGQIGCGKQTSDAISTPIQLKSFTKSQIKSIYCSGCKSYVLTNDGLVYSWGYNTWCELGHELDIIESLFEPKLINISNVISVCPSTYNTYFLTNEGLIYFCGKFKDENKSELFQKSPKLLETEIKIKSLHSIPYYQKGYTIASAVTQEYVYSICWNQFSKTEFKTIFDFYSKEYKMTLNTIELNENKSIIVSQKRSVFSNNHFNEAFEEMCSIGSGGFGCVVKVKDKTNQLIYAIKKIEFSEIDGNSKQEVLKEVDVMSKCSPYYSVKYYDSWFQNNCCFIQMELCFDNLQNIIENKSKCFARSSSESMNSIEFFISSHLFKELLECIQYLHELKPNPIIHRDLKPHNILVLENSRNGRFLKICDFGLAVYCSQRTQTHTQWKGTLEYMAPEVKIQTNGKTTYSTKANIFSLGLIASHLFDFNINSFEEKFNKSDEMNEKWTELHKQITKMMNPLYRERPTCAEVLSAYNQWSIDSSKLSNYMKTFEYKRDFNQMKHFSNQFFLNYFIERYNL